jgi:uncharacterized RDD family membrane protein YckC
MTSHEISPVPREARPYQGERAGVVTRMAANTIDALVIGLALVATYVGIAGLQFMLDPRSFTFPETSLLLSIAASMTYSVVYLAVAWWLVGRTYGAHVMGIRVVGRRGQRLGPLRALARSVFCVFFPIGLLWCAVSPERRSAQDLVLWTSVVYDWTTRDTQPHPADGTPPAGP